MKVFPCAKINLGLYVTERRPDGYHNLQTVFYPIPLCDELEVAFAESKSPLSASCIGGFPVLCDTLEMEGIHLEGPVDDNLVMRAVRLLRDEGHAIPPLRIRLCKHIPSGAGLGGGSSDAAYMLCLVNTLCQLGLSDDELERLAARLGADCAFFVRHRPVYATGIGDQFSPISLDLRGWWLLLIKPDDFISTREAYANVHPRLPRHLLTESILHPLTEWPTLIGNDFEESVFPQHPTVAHIKQQLYAAGAHYAAMSGSGSSVFGLFSECPAETLLHSFAPHFVFKAQL